jgi:hypothetical protein
VLRRLVALLLVLQLLILPGAGYAKGGEVVSAKPEKSLDANVSVEKGPKQAAEKEADYRDPSNYPLIGEGGYIDSLVDSYYNYQSIYYMDATTSPYSSDDMKIRLLYSSQNAYSKDSILTIEFFKESGNTLSYDSYAQYNTTGYSAVYLNSYLAKSEYADQPYIFLRVGVSKSPFDTYYSDVTTFKVANPFYAGSGVSNESYAVISDESTDANGTQPTGTFNPDLKSIKKSLDKSMKTGTYKIDFNKSFDSAVNKGKRIQKSTKSIQYSYNVGDSKSFWVTNLDTNTDYQIGARLAYSGTKANVWVNNNQISDTDAEKLGKEFDEKIYSSVTSNFGFPSDVDADGKVNILTYDIQDGFSGSGGYVAGYFWAGDLYSMTNSNKSEIFYIDTYPAMGSSIKDVTRAYETLAHEFQHMVNFNENVFLEGSYDNMDTWLNEGLSMAAEQIYSGTGLQDRIDYYNSSSSIQNGHSLLYWDDYGDTLSNYSLSYLFVQYVKKQANQGDKIFKEILMDPSNDYKAIENVAKKYISPDMTFGKLMTDFRIALLLKEPTGLYGFKGDPLFDSINKKIFTGSSTNLRGGGAVVTTYNPAEGLLEPVDKGQDVTYTLLGTDQGSGGTGTVDQTPPDVPVVNGIIDTDSQITGTTESGAVVYAMVGESEIGRTTSDTSGAFTMTIAKQLAGTTVKVYAQDAAGNVSEAAVVSVTGSGAGDEVAPLNSYMVTSNETWSNKTVSTDVYISPGAVLTISSNVIIYGNVYVLGGLISNGGLSLSGTLYANSVYYGYYGYPGNGQVYLSGSNSISGMSVSNRVLTDIPFNLYDTPLVSSKGNISFSGATLPFVSVQINNQSISLNANGTFKVNDFYVGDSNSLSVKITDFSGYTYYKSFEVATDILIDEFNKYSQSITGKTQPNATIKILEKGNQLGTGTSDAKGNFSIPVSNLVENSTLTFEVYNSHNEQTATKDVVVKDITAPDQPVVNDVTDKDTSVSGSAESRTSISVTRDGYELGAGTVGADGEFSLSIPVQSAGTELMVRAMDQAGNVSESTRVIVKDVTAPSQPEIYTVTDQDTYISGRTEPGAIIKVSNKGVNVVTGAAEYNGYFYFYLPAAQASGTELVVTAEDRAGNVSEPTIVVVQDATPPVQPVIQGVTDKDTFVVGDAEAGSEIIVQTNGSEIGRGTTATDGKFRVEIPVQKAGSELVITASDAAGNMSEAVKVVVKDVTAPVTPVVNQVTDKDAIVTGLAEVGSKIEVKVDGSIIGKNTADEKGVFKVDIPLQKAGSELVITASDVTGNMSEAVKVVVKDVTAPVKPTVNEVTERDTVLTGQAEAGSKVEVKVEGSVIGEGTADAAGDFKIEIPVQKAETELNITATDKSGNVSQVTTILVKDVTSPAKPSVNEVTDRDTLITGQAEVDSQVVVKVDGSEIGKGKADTAGNFKVEIPAQKAGRELVITATDKSGNVSVAVKVTVTDATAPGAPKVNPVSDKSREVTGTTEAGAKVTVKIGDGEYTGTADTAGNFGLTIPVQKAGTVLVIIATDAAGNESEGTTIKVIDKTAPLIFTVNLVSDKSIEVTGKTEAGATVSVSIGTKVYVGNADTNGNFKVIIPLQKAGTKLMETAKDAAGNVSIAKNITVLDKTAPLAPTVTTVSNLTIVVIGKAEAGAIVTVSIGTKKYSSKADPIGYYKVLIPVQKAGTKIIVTAKDAAGNVSVAKNVIVIDKIAPLAPKIKTTVKSTTKEVTGMAEAYSTITIKVDSKVIGTAKTDSKGNFKVIIKAQKKNAVLSVTATDKAKNVSKAATVKVK